PIGCAINFWCRLIHLKIILWNKPLEIGLCNKADQSHLSRWFKRCYGLTPAAYRKICTNLQD
ncbi:hypothetical protein NYZ58_17350, partial [Acinetobacter baumannii]|nr:hypothetical protein [Acinetobacter baumannii]